MKHLHLFVPYELALKLKEKGFDEPCFGDYFVFEDHQVILEYSDDRDTIVTDNKDENILQVKAPVYQQVIDWFREKHDLCIFIRPSFTLNEWKRDGLWNIGLERFSTMHTYGSLKANDYYEALNKAIEEALKLI